MIAGLGRLFFWSFGGTTEETVPLLLKLQGGKQVTLSHLADFTAMTARIAEMPTKKLTRNSNDGSIAKKSQ